MIMKGLKKLVFKFVFWSPLPLWSEGSFLFPTNRKCFTFNANGLFQPGQESSEPGVDPREALPGTAPAPADDSYLRVRSVLTQHSQRSPTVSITGVPTSSLGTDHVLSYPVVSVAAAPALTVGHGGHCRLLQNIGLGTRAGVPAPPSHEGAHIVVVLGRIWQADWLHSWKDLSQISVRNYLENLPSLNISGLQR